MRTATESTGKINKHAYKFFRQHAGYVVGENAKGAIALARAEQWARDNEYYYIWEWDDISLEDCNHDEWCKPNCGQEHEVLRCCLKSGDFEVLASLGAIIDAARDYGRVVEAELALEAMP